MSKIKTRSAARWSLISRLIAAIFGGYALASLLATVLALALPMPRVEASIVAMMVSLVAYAAMIMAVIHTRNASRAWIWLIGAGLPLLALLAVLKSAAIS